MKHEVPAPCAKQALHAIPILRRLLGKQLLLLHQAAATTTTILPVQQPAALAISEPFIQSVTVYVWSSDL